MRLVVAVYLGAVVLFAGVALVGGVVLFRQVSPSGAIGDAANRHAHNVIAWELRHFPEKWIYRLGNLIRDHSPADEEAAIRRYFELSRSIQLMERDPDAHPDVADARDERDRLQKQVEHILEGRVTRLLEDQGLTFEPPIFTDLGIVFPPVVFKLDSPPRVLVVSPRDEIRRDRSYMLRPGLEEESAVQMELELEAAEENASVYIVTTGGVATYPSVISDRKSYESLVDTVIHEWVHQYLIFFPLGKAYFMSSEGRTLNESVANIAGKELADLYFERYPRLQPTPEPAPPTPTPDPDAEPPFDFRAEMRALRLEVESLLADGKIEEAEALMEQKRDEFEEQGYYIRRITQAYFAWHGTYADTPASIDPIGPKLQTVLDLVESPGEFVRLAASLSRTADLESLLAELEG